jgi:unsaturated rhamnogalacturonyl hydrolase
MSIVNRRTFVEWTAAAVATVGAGRAFPAIVANAAQASSKDPVDWSLRLVESTLKRQPDPRQFGPWGYTEGLYLFGQYLVYRRKRGQRLLDFIVGYLNFHINEQGELDKPLHSLDDVLAANLLIVMYEEIRDPRYKLAAEKFRHFFDDYPRTTDGGF